MQSGATHKTRYYEYAFAEVDVVDVKSLPPFLTGLLVKFSEEGEEEVLDVDKQSLGKEPIRNKAKAKVRFFLNPKSGLIVYHGAGSDLGPDQFRKRYSELIQESRGIGFLQAEVQAITDQYQIFEQLEKFQKVTNLRVSLHPSNPNISPRWDEIDEDLKRKNAQRYTEELDAGEGSLNVDDEARQKLSMANDGYGKGRIRGLDENGEQKEVATDDQPTTAEVPREEGLSPSEILKYLGGKVRAIMDRFGDA